MAKRWYVVHAYSGYEKQVKAMLEEAIRREGMEEQFGRILVPTEEVVDPTSSKKGTAERKIFPGYLLIEMEMDEHTWHLVKSVPRITDFVGGRTGQPHPLPEKEAEAVLQQIEEGMEKPKPKVTFSVGEAVHVIDGPFSGFNGVVEDVNYEKSTIQASVTIFGRPTPVELEFSQVEKA
jgi:transcriptional antiterminator NusG